MRAVILAAGDGGRLGKRTEGTPKPLVNLGGRALIAYTLEAVQAAGVREVTVVTGYLEDQLIAALADGPAGLPALTFVSNPRFHAGASLSLRAARAAVGDEPFLLLMADHLLSAGIVSALIAAHRPGGPSLLATDSRPWPQGYAAEATRVRFEPGTTRVSQIAKQLPAWDALDTGAFLLAPEAWDAVDAVPEDCELSVVFGELARRGQLHAVDVSGARWYDVDNEADLEEAARLLAASNP